ncbi:isochorismatase family protein [bacterium]|nr:isochorismatase family protein [bacterium]MCI0605002.1 isochorismatase family protein [bacterium]
MTNIPRLNRDNILFIFIDLQDKLLMKIPDVQQLLSRNELLIASANALGLPYMVTSQYRRGLGEIAGSLRDKIEVPVLDKTSFSCVGDETIGKELEGFRRRSLVISGVETHICVMQTCLDLLAKGFQVSIVADAVGARKQADHELGLKRMESSGALPVTAEMVIYELLGRSDSDAFKKILPLIK